MTEIHRFAHKAMATAFEIRIVAENQEYARQAAAAAFREIDWLEQLTSRYIESSDISRINRLEAFESTPVSVETFDCLQCAAEVTRATGGAFDVTVGPLLALWRPQDGAKDAPPPNPPEDGLAKALEVVGMDNLVFDRESFRVGVRKSGVEVDLGGIGKGFALDRAAALLEDWDIENALLDAGDSTVLAMGAQPGQEGWSVGAGNSAFTCEFARTIVITQRALSGSGIEAQGRHILDPRTGRPALARFASWALCPSAAWADALSTAFLAMTLEEIGEYHEAHPDHWAMILLEGDGKPALRAFGDWERV